VAYRYSGMSRATPRLLGACAGLACAAALTLTPSGVGGLGGVATACAQDPWQQVPTIGPVDPTCGSVPDTDKNNVYDYEDNCNGAYNPSQRDTDKDSGEPPYEPIRSGYQDRDPTTGGDTCDTDDDNDGVTDFEDNCQKDANKEQRDTDGDGIGDECDPFPGSTAGCKVTLGGRIDTGGGDMATFGGVAQAKTADRVAGQLEYTDHGAADALRFKSLTVDSVVCADGGRATLRGTGVVDGDQPVQFRVDVTDTGEPGDADTYRIRLSNGYDSGERTLAGGNVQAHG
jgi:Thrombospondin type 3 repeat